MSADPLPPLAEFLRWVGEMPEVFSGEPEGFAKEGVPVSTVVADVYDSYVGELPDDKLLAAFRPASLGKVERNRLRWVLAACHVLWHPSLRGRTTDVAPAQLKRLLVQDLTTLAAAESVDTVRTEEDRREELIRRTMKALGLELPGESAKEAEDRFAQVDSVERVRLLREAAKKEKRAREVREKMAQRAAEEAAAKVSRE